MKARRKLAIAKTEKPEPARIHTGFTLDERDGLDRAKGRAHALVTAALTIHDHAADVIASDDDTHNAIGHLLEMAREHLETITETVAAADARHKANGGAR
jgi:hypothetical protein